MLLKLYMSMKAKTGLWGLYLRSYIRRLIRFIALPYCFFFVVNWDQCKKSKIKVINDFLYIFFVLKYYPDNYSKCRLWEKKREEWKYYYGSIYDPYQRRNLRRNVQPEEYMVIFEDKEICYQLCKSYNLPLPRLFKVLDERDNIQESIIEIFNSHTPGKLILKPIKGKGGKGVISVAKENGDLVCYEKSEIIELKELQIKERYLVQEFLPQHLEMNRIYPHAINTIRVETLISRNKIFILGAMVRFGRNGSRVDNLSSGGMGVGINIPDGRMMKEAHDFKSEIHTQHPDTGIVFNNFQIPMWDEVKHLAIKIQTHFPMYSLLGHDIAITPDGPSIIEINAAPDNVMMEQCFGPILESDAVLNEFKVQNLLTHNLLK